MRGESDDDSLMDDLATDDDSESGETTVVRYREFGVLRWVALGLMLGGGSILFSSRWWAGLAIGVVGFALLEVDNEKRRRTTHHSDDGD